MSRPTKPPKDEIIRIFYGINRKTVEVEWVSLTRGRILTRWGTSQRPHTHTILHGREARGEIQVVYDLMELIETSPQFRDDPDFKRKLEDLENKAARMRAERDAHQAAIE